MNRRIAAPKGTRDLLPPETAVWARVETVARRVFGLYGYREIRTPLFEETELFARGVGDATDIVGKEMYTFTDKGGRSLTLRPESTAAVCRAFVEHGMQQLPQPVRLYYIGPQFRYERPQKGRYRQFHQIGAELLGRPHGGSLAQADVEILEMLVRFLAALGFTDLKVLLNTVGDAESRADFRAKLVAYLTPRKDHLSEESARRLVSNPLRILDTKSKEEQALLEGAPQLMQSLTEQSRRHFNEVCATLSEQGIAFAIEPRLVRGLDYYTNTVFEIVSEGLGAQNAICGGGAYEGLVEELGGPPTYGVGFAIGEDRLIEVLPESSLARRPEPGPVLVRCIPSHERKGDSAAMEGAGAVLDKQARALAEELRAHGVPVLVLGSESSGNAYKRAAELASPFVAVLGEDEVAAGAVTVRDLATREQETVQREKAIARLKSRYEKLQEE